MSADGRISLLPSTALFDAHRPHLASYSYTQHVPPSSQSRPTSPLSASSTTSSTSSTPSLSSYASNDSVSSAGSADSNTAVTSHMHDAAGMTQILKHDGFTEIYQWHDGPSTVYDAHTHPTDNAYYILRGDMHVNFPSLGHVVHCKQGDRCDIAATLLHSGVVGPQGCVFMVGSRRPELRN